MAETNNTTPPASKTNCPASNANHPAEYWKKLDDKTALCELCPRYCQIKEGSTGACGVRANMKNGLVAAGYSVVSALALDPIEKKPLYLFHPGCQILSIGGFGCNFHCPFCQNSEISLEFKNTNSRRSRKLMSVDDIVSHAQNAIPAGNIGVAYTYNEPLIAYEFLLDCAKAVRNAGLKNVLVTNGCINPKPLETLLPNIDAMNIDLKAYSKDFYKKIGGNLETVKNTIIQAHRNCHIEITTLVIPDENENDIEPISKWLSEIDPHIPLHLSRFFPRYEYSDKLPTPIQTLTNLQKTAQKYLQNVFIGNV